MKKFTGLIPPMVTPLDERRRLDRTGVKNMVRHLVDGGVDGIFLLGTTGEGPHLPYAVRRELVRETCRLVKGRVPVLVGITETDLEDALAFAKDCKAFGAAGVVAAPPYYFKLTQSECVAWFTAMADRSPLPVVVYDMPAHTDTVIEPATIAKLAAHGNIVAMKDSSSVIALFNKFRLALEPFRDKFSLFMGPDEAMGEAVLLGADGGVCTGANLWPRAFKEMYLAAKAGDAEKVRRLQRFTTMSSYLLYGLGQGQVGFLRGVKAALAEMGLVRNVLSEPFTPFRGAELKAVRAALAKLKRAAASALPALLLAACLPFVSWAADAKPDCLYPDRAFTPMPYNSSGDTELGCGYLSHATPFDADGDGDWDIDSGGNGYNGQTRFYENPGKGGVFRRGVRPFKVGHCRFAMRADGGYTLTGRDTVSYSLPDGRPGPFRPLGVGTNNVHWGRVRSNTWLTKDFDGDGRDDLLVGVGDWREYGWDNAYDGVRQAWKNGRCRGLVYLLRNLGTRERPQWTEPALVRVENGEPVETMGNPHPMLEDFDGDGDLDLILSDFPGNYTYFENIGTRTDPVYTSGRLLHDAKGDVLAAPECIPVPQAIDWDRDGRIDIVAAQEDSRVCFYRNTGRFWKGMPVFEPGRFLRAERDLLHFGILVSPFVVDFDGDGDQDIVVGDAAGYLAWFENLSGPGVAQPKWDGPHYLSCEEPKAGYADVTVRRDTLQCSPFKHRAGHNGSIQGPVEAGFGYTCESVADWDGDGDLDIIYNHTWGKPMLLENVGTRRKPRFAAPRGIEVEWGPEGQPRLAWEWLTPERTGNPKELVSQWRTTPLMCDMNGDGLMDLVMSDAAGYLAFFERYRDASGKLRLKAPRRAFVDDATGKPMGVTGWREGNGRGTGGGSGRRKICLVDWDGDGRLDLVMNGGVNAVLWLQVRAENETWRFVRKGEFTAQQLAAHSTCPSACDFNGDGVSDLVLGVEDGILYHFENPRTK